MLRRPTTGLAPLAVGLLLGCQPRVPELDAAGARVAVGSEADVELCAGTLNAFDEHVAFVEEQLGIARPPEQTLNVFMLEDTTAWCRDVEACYIGGWVDATFVPVDASESVWHELVHQVVAGSDIGMTDRFLSEGLASALGDDWCPPSASSPWPQTPLAQLLGKHDVAFEDYPRGASFVDFVRGAYGTDALVELVRCAHRGDAIGVVDACFERVFQRGIARVGREFQSAAPPPHPNPALCRGPVERWPEAGAPKRWQGTLAIGCDAPTAVNTFESTYSREVATLIEIPAAGWYELDTNVDGHATVDIKSCLCSGSGSGLRSDGDRGAIWIGEPGVHRVVVRTDDPSASRAELSLSPSRRELSPPL